VTGQAERASRVRLDQKPGDTCRIVDVMARRTLHLVGYQQVGRNRTAQARQRRRRILQAGVRRGQGASYTKELGDRLRGWCHVVGRRDHRGAVAPRNYHGERPSWQVRQSLDAHPAGPARPSSSARIDVYVTVFVLWFHIGAVATLVLELCGVCIPCTFRAGPSLRREIVGGAYDRASRISAGARATAASTPTRARPKTGIHTYAILRSKCGALWHSALSCRCSPRLSVHRSLLILSSPLQFLTFVGFRTHAFPVKRTSRTKNSN